MVRKLTIILLGLALAGAVGGATISGQAPKAAPTPTRTIITAQPNLIDIYFAFKVGNTKLPAGTYLVDQSKPGVITLRSKGPGLPTAQVAVLTRLGAPTTRLNAPRLAFDTVGYEHVLSEVWVPGADGYLVATATTGPSHEVVTGGRPAVQRTGLTPTKVHRLQTTFPFTVGNNTLPPGQYDFVETTPDLLTLRSALGGPTVQCTVLTRLAASNGNGESRVVFNAVGNQRQLSEVWLPGEDGFLLDEITVPHTHASVPLTNK